MKHLRMGLLAAVTVAAISASLLGASPAATQSPTATPSSTVEANRETIKGYFAAQNSGNLDAAFAFFSPDIKAWNPSVSPEPLDIEGIKGFFAVQLDAMPNLNAEIIDTIAEGDKVAVRFVVTGTLNKEFFGQPAGTQMSMPIITIYRLENGKIIEVWSN